jgi:F-type H+-transporting ATPase subunit b
MRNTIFSALSLMFLAAPAFAEEAAGGGPLTVNGGLVIWTLVVFGLLLFILRRSAWPVLLSAVREREARLEQQIADAEKARQEAASLLEQHKKLLAGAKGEAHEILALAKSAGEKERDALLHKARQEYDALLGRARKEIDDEKEKAVLALRREAVDLSIAAASKLIEQKLDSDANRKLVMDYLETIGSRS